MMTNIGSNNDGGGERHVCVPSSACLSCLVASNLAAELTESQTESLLNIVSIRRMSKGEALLFEGESDNNVYAIAKGKFEVVKGESVGREIPLAHLRPGMITGELAFLDGLKRTATVKAATDDCCAIALDRESVESMLEVDGMFVYKIMRTIVRSAYKTVAEMNAAHINILQHIQG